MKAARRYGADTPQACARVLALALLADGELDALEDRMRQGEPLAHELGLDAMAWSEVLKDYADEQKSLRAPRFATACQADPLVMSALFNDITCPVLRRQVLTLCARLVEGDERLESGEYLVLTAAVEHWGLQSGFMPLQEA